LSFCILHSSVRPGKAHPRHAGDAPYHYKTSGKLQQL
jgi:hypothetical protein